MKRHSNRFAAICLATVLAPAAAMASTEPGEWRFKVLLDEKEIGYFHLQLSDLGAEKKSTSEVQFNVKFLFFNAYHYEHRSTEVWQGDCLAYIDSQTDANGKQLFVHGVREPSGFTVDSSNGADTLPACVMTFAYWNPRILKATHLLNAQSGEYFDVEVKPLGFDPVTVSGTPQPAQHHQLKTAKFSIDVWYSPEGRWLGLASTTEKGKRLRYELE